MERLIHATRMRMRVSRDSVQLRFKALNPVNGSRATTGTAREMQELIQRNRAMPPRIGEKRPKATRRTAPLLLKAPVAYSMRATMKIATQVRISGIRNCAITFRKAIQRKLRAFDRVN